MITLKTLIIIAPAELRPPAFDLTRPLHHVAPLVFVSAHSGRDYPEEFLAAARLDELRAERRQLERDIVRTLSVLRSDARAGQLRLRSTRDAVRANAASVASARERFAIGRASILQLLDSQRDLASAEELASIAERDLSLSGYAALALTGDIVHAFGLSLPGLDQALNGRRGSAWAGPASPPADATVTAP
jgi:hypothetical protein